LEKSNLKHLKRFSNFILVIKENAVYYYDKNSIDNDNKEK